MTMGRLGVVGLLVLVASSCGDSHGKHKVARPGAAGGAIEPAGSVLSRHDRPPAGVSATYQGGLVGRFGFGGCGATTISCSNGACTQPVLLEASMPGEAQTMAPVHVCLDGLGSAPRLVVTSPSGQTRTYRPAAGDDSSNVSWLTLLPRGPAGTYTVTASSSDGSNPVSRRFEVGAATAPALAVNPDSAAPGGVFMVSLAGFAASKPARVHVYRSVEGDDGEPAYVTTLPVVIDAEGEGELSIAAQAGDPVATYILVSDPGEALITFDLTAP